MTLIERLEKLGACGEAIYWIEAQNTRDVPTLWSRCPDFAYMAWLACHLGFCRETVLVACDIAENTVTKYWHGGREPANTIMVARSLMAEPSSDSLQAVMAAARILEREASSETYVPSRWHAAMSAVKAARSVAEAFQAEVSKSRVANIADAVMWHAAWSASSERDSGWEVRASADREAFAIFRSHVTGEMIAKALEVV